MRVIHLFIGLAVFCWAVQQRDCKAETIMCDPTEKAAIEVLQQDSKAAPVITCNPNKEITADAQQQDCKAPVIMCDPNEKIPVTVNVLVDDKILDDLQQKGVQELALVPASDFFWTKAFPLEPKTTITLYDEADPLTLSFQEGLLVTYPKGCEEDFVYAFCHMDGVDLKGEFPKEVNLYLNPALGKCTIEVVCTQCP